MTRMIPWSRFQAADRVEDLRGVAAFQRATPPCIPPVRLISYLRRISSLSTRRKGNMCIVSIGKPAIISAERYEPCILPLVARSWIS
jgi:hypothetical protein